MTAMVTKSVVVAFLGLALSGAASAQQPPPSPCPGKRDLQTRTLKQRAWVEHWPGFAAIRLRSSSERAALYFCGGTVIDKQWVLTAAHCFDELQRSANGALRMEVATKYRHYVGAPDVVIGVEDLVNAHDLAVHEIEDVIVHPEYKYPPQVHGNDIALVKLKRAWEGVTARLSLSSTTDLPDRDTPPEQRNVKGQEERPTTEAIVAGFGLIIGRGEMELFRARIGLEVEAGSSVLRETGLPVVRLSECQKVHSGSKISQQQICAGDDVPPRGRKRDSCDGDSGGPLVALDINSCPYQIGLVSWGPVDCGRPKAYGVYTRVSSYGGWLASHVPSVRKVALSTPRLALESIASALTELEILVGGQDKLSIAIPGGPIVKLGSIFTFEIKADIGGRLIVLDVDAQGIVTQIFPNVFTPSNRDRIEKSSLLRIPTIQMGFDGFRASEPVGKGTLVAVVVPEDSTLTTIGVVEEQRARMLEPAPSGLNYLINFLRQTEDSISATRAQGGNPRDVYAVSKLEYEITR